MHFVRPEHQIIAEMLERMDSRFLLDCECWFGGGTAIVLKLGEYRKSLDLDFLCASREGYRKLREGFFEHGVRAVFPEPVQTLREVRADAEVDDTQGLVVRSSVPGHEVGPDPRCHHHAAGAHPGPDHLGQR